ncbi:hypothetical protein C1868_15515 [Eggerthella lenta]|nr:hypothetical protein C1874_15120 [Eggerthella lenta]RDB88743.1 hypothetical protein C1868_15515 [Eggerthella lenta]
MSVFLGQASPALQKRIDTPTFGTLPMGARLRPDAEFRSRDDGEEGEIPRPSFGKEWIYAFRNSATLFAASRPEFTWLPNA